MAHIKKQYTLDDIVLYPDEYDYYNHIERFVPVIMKDGIACCLNNKQLEYFLAEAISKLEKNKKKVKV
jgi:hypothetical protein